MKRTAVLLTVLATISTVPIAGQNAPLTARYTKREVRIPMRDGVRLFTAIYTPNDSAERHPIMLTRTPYSVAPYGAGRMPGFGSPQQIAYLRENYILVFQDVRGRWMSEGDFVDVRPVLAEHRASTDIDETTDTWDTVEWLVHNVPFNNGRVGMRGTSYPGFYASMGAINAHPAMKAVSPQAPVTEWMGGDDFFHNGALLLPHAFDFFAGFGRARPEPTTERGPRFDHGTPDGYAFFLTRLGAIANANPRFYHDSIAFWNQMARHPTWDAFWQARSARPHLRNLTPAMLWVGGWFDTENLWGALHAYAAAERQSPGAENRLVMGPWSHGQWNGRGGDSLGMIAWDQATAQFFTDSIEVPFFEHWLRNGPPPRDYEAAVFETGTNQWRFVDTWPVAGTVPAAWYLREHGRLAPEHPTGRGVVYDEYVSDPAHPVPYTAEITHWYNRAFMLEDQRFASRRPDVLTYQSEVLTAPVTVAGPIAVDFVVSTSGTDADWIVKLIDVFPDTLGRRAQTAAGRRMGGYQMLVRGDVMRGKFRDSMTNPQPFRPDTPTPLAFTMNDVLHTFQAGHRIMVQVQSTWFPMIDRNPGRFMDIWRAGDGDFRATTQRVYRNASRASRVLLPVLTR